LIATFIRWASNYFRRMLSITIAGGKGIGALRAQNTFHDVNRKYVLNNRAVRAMGMTNAQFAISSTPSHTRSA